MTITRTLALGAITIALGAGAVQAQEPQPSDLLLATLWMQRSVEFKGALADDIRAHVWPLVVAGKLRPVMDRTFALTEAADAHARMETGGHVGKIVLQA